MPKSSKKRRDKAADFSKAKLKLGKGKQAPTNAINTSFKARSIALPTQSITVEKDEDIPTTKRRLTFEDLIAHIKHYSAGTRKDAILGLRELFEAHPELIQTSLTSLLNACVRVIGDEDASVRKTLLSFFTWLLPRIPREFLIPHSQSLLLFTTSAQSHIFPEIRIDSIRFLDLFLELFPDLLVEGWAGGGDCHGSRILEGYLGLLSATTKFDDGAPEATSNTSVVLSPTSKLVVLRSLSTFLRNALSPHTAFPVNYVQDASSVPTNAWYLGSSFSSSKAFETFHQMLNKTSQPCRRWKEGIVTDMGEDDFIQKYELATEPFESHWTLQQLSDVVSVTGSLSHVDSVSVIDVTSVARLARAMHSILISTFLDCAPAVFSPSVAPPEADMRLVVAIGEITRSLYGAILKEPDLEIGQHDALCENLRSILGYMAAYFPFRPGGNRDVKTEEAFQDLNIIFCELTSLLMLSSETHLHVGSRKSRQAHGSMYTSKAAFFSEQTERVSEYVVQLLKGEFAASSQLGRPLSLAAYLALLPTIWSLLNSPSTSQPHLFSDVLQAVVEHAIKTSSKSAPKKSTIEFVARIVLLETECAYQGNFKVGRNGSEVAKLEEWIGHLPKTLWELGSSNVICTETILRFLLRLFQRRSCLVNQEVIRSVRSRLVPYFSITHVVRGKLPGPYTKLPDSGVRRLALDMVTTLASSVVGQDDGLGAAVGQAVADTEEGGYWMHLSSI